MYNKNLNGLINISQKFENLTVEGGVKEENFGIKVNDLIEMANTAAVNPVLCIPTRTAGVYKVYTLISHGPVEGGYQFKFIGADYLTVTYNKTTKKYVSVVTEPVDPADLDDYQTKLLDNALNINGTEQTTVEGALSGLNDYSDDITDVITKNGAVNLANNTLVSGTSHGITITVNPDLSVSLSGTATEDTNLYTLDNNTSIPSGRYKIVGCPEGGGTDYWLSAVANNKNVWLAEDDGNGYVFDYDKATQNNISVYITIKSGADVTGLTFKPMIALASQPNVNYNNYVPYAMTNRELTVKASLIDKGKVSVVADGVKTYAELFNELAATIDTSRMTPDSYLMIAGYWIFKMSLYGSGSYEFASGLFDTTSLLFDQRMIYLATSASAFASFVMSPSSTTYNDLSSSVPSSGNHITIVY